MEEAAKERIKQALNELARWCHELAKEKGWWSQNRNFGEIIALCHSELSEALEEYRNGVPVDQIYFKGDKPEGIPVELADAIIRIMDLCGGTGMDIGEAVVRKMEYNAGRPFRHGGKKI